MNKIIRISPAEGNMFSVSWIIHLKCNYDCMYCPPDRHTNESDMKSLEDLKRYWQEIFDQTKHLNKLYKFSISGGEPTVNKNLILFLEWLRSEFGQHFKMIGITTNGSASTQYYLKLFSLVDFIAFSTHSEHIQVDRFFESAQALAKYAKENNKSFNVNIMQEFWATDAITDYVARCKEHEIYHSFSEIDYKKQTRTIPIFKNKKDDTANS